MYQSGESRVNTPVPAVAKNHTYVLQYPIAMCFISSLKVIATPFFQTMIDNSHKEIDYPHFVHYSVDQEKKLTFLYRRLK